MLGEWTDPFPWTRVVRRNPSCNWTGWNTLRFDTHNLSRGDDADAAF